MNLQESLLIFIFGSTFGSIFEIAINFFINKKFKKTGFLKGPYLPLHGLGAILILMLSYFEVNILMRVILFLILTTLLEFLTGIIFLKKNIKIWDYSRSQKLHYKGLIGFSSSLTWLVLALMFYFFIFPHFSGLSNYLWDQIFIKILIFIWYVIFFIDVKVSLRRIKKKQWH